MPVIATHDHFMACLDAFLAQIAQLTGIRHPKDQNMLQFVIGLGAGVGSTDWQERPPLKIEFRDAPASPMKTILHVREVEFTQAEAERIAAYFNHKHGAYIAKVVQVPYLKGNHETIEVFSGALVDELDVARDFQEIQRTSLMAGVDLFMHLPISGRAKAELQSPEARVDITPDAKRGMDQHRITMHGISEESCEEIIAAIAQTYGQESIRHG